MELKLKLNMKYIKTFEEFVNENYSVNEADVPKNYMKGGYHYIAIVDEDDALNPKFRKMKKQLIAVYGGLKYVYSVKKGKTLETVLDPRLPISPISKMIYDVDSGKFYSPFNKKELPKETELNYPFVNTKVSDVEQDFKVAATGHVNDYEKIGAKIKKVSESNRLLKAKKLSSAEYQKVKNLKGFNEDDYIWNPDEQLYIRESVLVNEKKKLPKEIANHKDIPSWANYVAQHSDGEWTWYEETPTIVNFRDGGGAWKQDGNQIYTGVKTDGKDWNKIPTYYYVKNGKITESFDEPGYTPHKLKNSRLVMKTRDEIESMIRGGKRHHVEKLLNKVNDVKNKLQDKYNKEQEGHDRYKITSSLSDDMTYLRSYAKIINYLLEKI